MAALDVHQNIAELRAELAQAKLTKAERVATEIALEAALDRAELESREAKAEMSEILQYARDAFNGIF